MHIKEKRKYIVGRNNLAATIFVPYDCPNHCKFCTSKQDYADKSNFSLEAILESISKIKEICAIRDVVITGGEPFANLEQLQKIIDACHSTGKNYL